MRISDIFKMRWGENKVQSATFLSPSKEGIEVAIKAIQKSEVTYLRVNNEIIEITDGSGSVVDALFEGQELIFKIKPKKEA